MRLNANKNVHNLMEMHVEIPNYKVVNAKKKNIYRNKIKRTNNIYQFANQPIYLRRGLSITTSQNIT